MTSIVFLDRDGVINEEVNYLSNPDEFRFLPGSVDAIKLFNEYNMKVVVISNQSGVARGYFTDDDVNNIHNKMLEELKKSSAHVDGIYYCPHHPDDNCECRKPKTGLFKKALKDLDINNEKAFLIGDKMSDIIAGKKMGYTTFLVLTGYGRGELKNNSTAKPDYIVQDLYEAAIKIIEMEEYK